MQDSTSGSSSNSGGKSFSLSVKIHAVKEVLEKKRPLGEVAGEVGCTRQALYLWIKTYTRDPASAKNSLQNAYVFGRNHHKSISWKIDRRILDLVIQEPGLGVDVLRRRLQVLGINISTHGIYNILLKYGLHRKDLRYRFSLDHPLKTVFASSMSPANRAKLLGEYLERKKSIPEVCKAWNISRPTFYAWLKRYKNVIDANGEQAEAVGALLRNYKKGWQNHRACSENVRNVVKGIVVKNPQYSVRSIFKAVPVVGGRPVVGWHGIQNILAREDLNTYEKRLRFAQGYTQAPEVAIAPLYIPQIPLYKLRHLIAHFATVPKLVLTNPKQGLPSAAVSLSSLLIFFLWIRLLATTPGQSPVGLFFASIALLFGLFFFIYSMKYYISTLMVLKLAQGGGVGTPNSKSEIRNPNLGSSILTRAAEFSKKLGIKFPAFDYQSRVNPLLINLEKVELNPGERPFVSIHVAIYNERRVVERLIRACEAQEWNEEVSQVSKVSEATKVTDESSSSLAYRQAGNRGSDSHFRENDTRGGNDGGGSANYEVIIADDSTDETYEIAKQLLSSEGRILDRILNNSEMEIYVSSPPVGSSLPVIKLIHRFSRFGFKGGALQKALENTSPKAQYITVFDADFVPYPDTLEQFVKTFQVLTSTTSSQGTTSTTGSDEKARDTRDTLDARDTSNIAAVQGYQWHVLNKSQNWVTKGVRTEYAGSYVIERAGEEIYGGLKQIAGSVYMIRAEILRQFGWGKSITEDFELTLRLYEQGYKVAFTPYIQAPAEAVSTLKRLIRQRMRWAEGASFNIKVMLGRMLWGRWEEGDNYKLQSTNYKLEMSNEVRPDTGSRKEESGHDPVSLGKVWVKSRLSRAEKLEFAYLAPYYLQAAFFVIGTFSWFISETIIGTRLPFWTAALGWSLVFTNLLSLPLMNIVGMFLEESDERDYIGILSFIALSYIVVPFQAYAAIKGFLETEEGPWFRTPKTGLITDTLGRSGFSKFFGNILGRPSSFAPAQDYGTVSHPAVVSSSIQVNTASNGMLMASAQKDDSQEDNWGLGFLSGGISAYRNFSFAEVPVPSQRRVRWVGKLSLIVLIIFSLYLSPFLSYLEPKMNSQQKEIAKTALNLKADNGAFAYNQNPAFTLKVDDKVIKRPQNNFNFFGIPIIKNIFAADFEVKTSLSLGGEPVDIKSKAMEEEDGTFRIELDPQERTFKPGKYTLGATVVSGKEMYETSQDFSWGVLVINTNKDSYEPGEEIKFGFGVLNDMGQTICDASLKLTIIVPSQNKNYELSTDNGQIKPSGECTKTSVTNTADYLASFTAKENEESYNLHLEAKSANGVRSVSYPLKVKRGEPFTVERVSYPTRFYPPAEYEAKMIIHANQDFKGKVNDVVPESFEISDISDKGRVSKGSGKTKEIVWNADWKAGQAYSLSYKIKFPKESPQFYFVGPLRLVPHQSSGLRSGQALFGEARQWQIAADAPGPTVITSIPRATHSISFEQVGGTNAHIVTINNPVSTQPNYKWQFLTGGTRLFIDRKAGAGWVQLVSQIQTAPEYMKQQGAPGNFVWNPYGLNINTTGANVLQGFDRQDQADGSTKLVRTYSTFEEGIAESLTETWTIPKTTEDLAVKGPKATYSMTKNRGIVVTKGVNEGTWRMRWAISGIADIVADSSDIKDESGWPIRKKSYANGDFVINVDDFDNQFNSPMFSFSEVASNNKAEVLFFKDGTTGDRVVDPTVAQDCGGSGCTQAWLHNRQRNVQYNGSNWFVFYNKGSTSLFAKAASTVAGLNGATEQTALNALMDSNTDWDIYWVTDTKFDIVYIAATDGRVQTCTVSGTTIDCTTLARSAAWTTQNWAKISITRTRSVTPDRVWLTGNTGNSFNVAPAGQAGDSDSITSWGNAHNALDNADGEITLIPFDSADTVLAVHQENPGGTGNDGIFSFTCTQAGGCGALATVQKGSNPLSLAIRFGNGFWVSDTDLRFVYVDNSATNQLIEATHNGGGPGTWTITEVIDTAGGQTNPSVFYDSQENEAYVFYEDSASPQNIQRYRKPTASTYSTNWDSKTDVDAGEADANSLPVTQMHEPPLGATQTRTPRELSWCWRNANGSNFDVVCDNLNLAVVPENIYILAVGGPVIFMVIRRMKRNGQVPGRRRRRRLNDPTSSLGKLGTSRGKEGRQLT